MIKLCKYLFLLIFCGTAFCLDVESDDEADWKALSKEIDSLLFNWGNELENNKENSKINANKNNINTCYSENLTQSSLEKIIINIRLINEIFDSEIYRKIREIFEDEKCFILCASNKEIEEILFVLKEKNYCYKVRRSSKNYLLNMRELGLPTKEPLNIRRIKQECQ